MKSTYCNDLNGSWPPWDKLRNLGITRIYVKPTEPDLKGVLDGIASQKFQVGIWRSNPQMSAVDLARAADADISRVGYNSKQLAYDFDIEYPNRGTYITDWLYEWRGLRPTRSTAWTMEPNQGGWMASMSSFLMSDINLVLKPQTYFGGMQEVAPDEVLTDLEDHGFDRHRVELVRDGAHLPYSWKNGTVFTTQRIP